MKLFNPSKNLLIFSLLVFTCGVSAQAQLKNESSAGAVVTTGNSQSVSISLKQKNEYEWTKNTVKFFGDFLTASNRGVRSAYNWDLGARYERELNDEFHVFFGEKVDSDIYQNVLQRYSTDIGAKYFFKKTEGFKWFSEAGYRFSRENYPYGFKNFNFIRLYNEMELTFTKTNSLKWWAEYLPNITESAAYQFNTEISLSAALSEIFAVKSAYLIKYYNAPPIGTAYRTDTAFTTSLVAKF